MNLSSNHPWHDEDSYLKDGEIVCSKCGHVKEEHELRY